MPTNPKTNNCFFLFSLVWRGSVPESVRLRSKSHGPIAQEVESAVVTMTVVSLKSEYAVAGSAPRGQNNDETREARVGGTRGGTGYEQAFLVSPMKSVW